MTDDEVVEQIISGPCQICGATNYGLSYGGSTICPSCDCGDFGIVKVQRQRKQIDSLTAALAAQEAENRRLREALRAAEAFLFPGPGTGFKGSFEEAGAIVKKALSLPLTTALAERERDERKVVEAATTLVEESPIGDDDRPYISEVAHREFAALVDAVSVWKGLDT